MIERVLEWSPYLTVVRWIINGLWFVSVPNTLGWFVAKLTGRKWVSLAELYQVAVVGTMLYWLFKSPISWLVVAWAVFRPFEISVFIFAWILDKKPLVSDRRSLIAFIVNQVE
jgi:hypothetical protein